jgi:Prokaryotic E2 family E
VYDPTRLAAELELLRTTFRDLETREADGRTWVRLPSYAVPEGWSASTAEVVFAFPVEVGQPPYAFQVRPALTLATGNAPSNYTPNVTTPWGDGFAQFSWSPNEPWIPTTDLRAGANMLNFAMSFRSRLEELS